MWTEVVSVVIAIQQQALDDIVTIAATLAGTTLHTGR
jgi:hypothetical protein